MPFICGLQYSEVVSVPVPVSTSHFILRYPWDTRGISHFCFQCPWDSRGLSVTSAFSIYLWDSRGLSHFSFHHPWDLPGLSDLSFQYPRASRGLSNQRLVPLSRLLSHVSFWYPGDSRGLLVGHFSFAGTMGTQYVLST